MLPLAEQLQRFIERGARVHIVHARVMGPSGKEAGQRIVLRRFRIGPGERYRTAAERLAKLDLIVTAWKVLLSLGNRWKWHQISHPGLYSRVRNLLASGMFVIFALAES